MKASGSLPTPPFDAVNAEPWLTLFDRLDVTLQSAGGPQAQRVFRALGPRRRAHALRRLMQERQRLVVEFANIGVRLALGHVATAQRLRADASLDTDYARLAEAFERCATVAQRLEKSALHRWLLERSRMHRESI